MAHARRLRVSRYRLASWCMHRSSAYQTPFSCTFRSGVSPNRSFPRFSSAFGLLRVLTIPACSQGRRFCSAGLRLLDHRQSLFRRFGIIVQHQRARIQVDHQVGAALQKTVEQPHGGLGAPGRTTPPALRWLFPARPMVSFSAILRTPECLIKLNSHRTQPAWHTGYLRSLSFVLLCGEILFYFHLIDLHGSRFRLGLAPSRPASLHRFAGRPPRPGSAGCRPPGPR